MNYTFEKDEFNYFATALIFGKRSPNIKYFKQFSFSELRRYQDISFRELQQLNVDNCLDTKRTLLLNHQRMFIATKTVKASGICQVISFVDHPHIILEADTLFTDEDFEYFKNNWDDVVKDKIRILGDLIRAVYLGELYNIPIMVSNFTNITRALIDHPEYWLNNNERRKFKI
jgi:hypothetical protein